jgi:DNA-binding LacI/PurR family transcriptional regulator
MAAEPPPSVRRATIKDVAARAGVSYGAVSLAMHDRPGVSRATRERILTAARELGWTPNQAARSLSSTQPHTIGLAIARPARMLGLEPFYMEFISGVESILEQHSCALLLRLLAERDEVAIQTEWWQGRRVNGSLLVDLKVDDPRIPALSRIGLPAVAVGHPSLAGPFTAVWTDDAGAVTEAVRYLAALGHRRIARVGGPAVLGHSAIRTEAFRAVAQDLGLLEYRCLATDFSADEGARATRSLLVAPQPPTAIMYDNDVMAVAGLAVAGELGLAVPAELSLLAWDDSQLCQLTRPMLSAMSHDVFGFGAEVARCLFDVIEGRDPQSHVSETPVLVPRGSTAPPPRR